VLVARAYYEVIQHLKRNAGECFRHLGVRRDPLARDHDLYLWNGEHLAVCGAAAEPSLSRPASGADITPAAIDSAERILAQHIGPMARILVRMLPAQPHSTGAGPNSARPAATSLHASPASPSAPVTAAASGLPTGVLLADADLERIGKLFARYIGPMAKVLLRREVAHGGDLEALCRALARHIDSAEQRQHFLREAGVG
jgi:hypothetical protein